MYGELTAIGGGDPIPLLKESLKIGRRESNDIVLRFANVSGEHAILTLESGYWFITDLDSSNGTKVNGSRVVRKRLDPGDELAIAKHKYKIDYIPSDCGATSGPPPDEDQVDQILSASLLQRAGLQKRPTNEKGPSSRFDVNNNQPGQLRKPNSRDL